MVTALPILVRAVLDLHAGSMTLSLFCCRELLASFLTVQNLAGQIWLCLLGELAAATSRWTFTALRASVCAQMEAIVGRTRSRVLQGRAAKESRKRHSMLRQRYAACLDKPRLKLGNHMQRCLQHLVAQLHYTSANASWMQVIRILWNNLQPQHAALIQIAARCWFSAWSL
jgi:hypothetical protein